MKIATINASEEHNQYIGQVYQEHYATLRHYFQTQLDDNSEADDCVHETIRRFFFFMEDRHWETEAEYISVYLKRIAGLLCTRKLVEKKAHHMSGLEHNEHHGLFSKIRTEAIRTIKERIEFRQSLLSPADSKG
jgi:DNA-directed RNA polymerase specialized sigma24 family protein